MRTFVLASLLLTSLATAQSPQLLVQDGDKRHPIALAKADIHAAIHGYLSQTTMTLTFRNDADRVLEGELVFPLPENATVCAYALDVGGELVDAVVVEKEKARVAFETEVRRGIDPGLVEKVQGNNFRTRIYPIPARGTRTIRVQYVSELAGGDGSTLNYVLPLKWDDPIAQASLKIEVLQSPVEPKVASGEVKDLKFIKWEDRFVAEQKFADARLNTTLTVALPTYPANTVAIDRRTRSTVSIENLDPKTADQFVRTDHYFVINDRPTVMIAKPQRARPSRIGIAWDASLSRMEQDHKRELALIESQIKAMGSGLVDVVVFRNVPEPAKRFDVKDGNAAEVLKFLTGITYDGGTSLATLGLVRYPSPVAGEKVPAVAYWLLFTDGLANLGADVPALVETPVYAVAIDPRSNHTVLRYVSTTSGGQYLNLMSLTDEQAQASITPQPFSLMAIEYNKEEVAEVYPRLPLPVQGRVAVAGRLLAKTAKITLVYGVGGQETSRQEVTLAQDKASEMGLASRYWAQLKLADLSIMEAKNEREIIDLGKTFGLVTAHTSMIVLETTEQYLRHKIIPPKSRPKIYAEFMAKIEQQRVAQAGEEKAKIDRVLAMWKSRLDWWTKEYNYPKDLKYVAAKDDKRAAGRDGGRGGGGGLFGGGATAGAAPAQAATEDPHPTPRPPSTPTARPAESPRPEGRPMREGANGERTVEQLRRLDSDHPTPGQAESASRIGAVRAKGGKGDAAGPAGPVIQIKEWTPDTPYLKALQAARPDDAYGVYSDQPKAFRSSPAFYLDCADHFARIKQPELAMRILTNIPELALDDGRILRIAAHRMAQLGHLDMAVDLFEKVAKLRPEEPQSFRDLALVLADRAEARIAAGDRDRARSDFERSLELLHKVVMNNWQRFEEVEAIALEEANRIIARAQRALGESSVKNPFDPRLVKLLDMDVRIVMTWDTDNTDIDLHVLEPSGEECFYGHNRTTIGGLVSRDFTQGYGPEEYCLRKLMPGEYKIKAHFYGNRDQKLVGPTTVQATVITNFGRPDEKRQSLTLRLKDAKDMVDIGTVTLKP